MVVLEGYPVLVTGGCGYLGSKTVSALIDSGCKVSVIDDLSSGSRMVLDSRASFFEGGIENAPLVRGVIEMRGIRAVIHLAGIADAGDSVGAPMRYYRSNTSATRSLIESAYASGVHQFLMSSTADVYDSAASSPLTESAATRPPTPYAMSELMKERILADTGDGFGLSYCVLRHPYTAGGDPRLHGARLYGQGTFIEAAIATAIGKRDLVRIAVTDGATIDGSALREFIAVDDIALAHVAALRTMLTHPLWRGVFNCGIGRGFSEMEVVNAVERVTNLTVRRAERTPTAGEPLARVLDSSAFRNATGWRPVHDNLDDLVRMVYLGVSSQLRVA